MFQGSMVALVTPMQEDGAIDWPTLARLVDWHIAQGTTALVVAGTTGESATLTVDEHCALIEAVVKQVHGRIPVIAGTGANSTQEAIVLSQAAQTAGADACLLVTPYYNKPTQEGLYQHYRAIAEAVAMPQILYNVPSRTACDMSNDTVVRLAVIDNIVGVKDATGDVARGVQLIERCADRLEVYSGDDPTAVELMHAGAVGTISVTANVVPSAIAELCTALNTGAVDRARQLNEALMPLHKALFVESNPIPVKWLLYDQGKIGSGIRLPLTMLSEAYRAPLRTALAQWESSHGATSS